MGISEGQNSKLKLGIVIGVLVLGVGLTCYNLFMGDPAPGEVVPADAPPPPPEPGAAPVNPAAVPPRPSFAPPTVK